MLHMKRLKFVNTLDLGASDAAFAPSALVWRADDYTAGEQKLSGLVWWC